MKRSTVSRRGFLVALCGVVAAPALAQPPPTEPAPPPAADADAAPPPAVEDVPQGPLGAAAQDGAWLQGGPSEAARGLDLFPSTLMGASSAAGWWR